MGLLDKKHRIVDTLLTPVGKRNFSKGNLDIQYIAFTDIGGMYKATVSGSRDTDFKEIGFESLSSYQDEMFFTAQDIGKTVKYNTLKYVVTPTGNVYDAVQNYEDKSQMFRSNIVTGSNILNGFSEQDIANSDRIFGETAFASIAGEIINDSFENLQNKYYLLNRQRHEFNEFTLDKNTIYFDVSNNTPISIDNVKDISLNSAEPFFFDQYVSNTSSFKFLPPVFPKKFNNGETIGQFTDLNQKNIENYDDVENVIKDFPQREVIFEKSSIHSNIILQAFDITSSTARVVKLDTIDFGEFNVDGKFKKVIFIGKTFIDDFNYPTYINLFTLILEE